MRISCKLIGGYKKKKEDDSRYYWWLGLSDLKHYEDLPKEFDVQFELIIYSINENGEEVERLVSKKFFKTGETTHYIHFHTVNYCYDEAKDIIYSTTLEHNI